MPRARDRVGPPDAVDVVQVVHLRREVLTPRSRPPEVPGPIGDDQRPRVACPPRATHRLAEGHPLAVLTGAGDGPDLGQQRLVQHPVAPWVPHTGQDVREQAALRISRYLETTPEQIQVTTGSQEGLFVVAQALVNPGDVVLVERPTYLAAVQAFELNGARLIGVPTDANGVIPHELEKLIAEHSPKFVYLIPSFQNPSGVCMSVERRAAVADVLLRTGAALVEDDPYGELCFDGEPLPPIASQPGMPAQTILLNSVSKVIAPGVRIGWMRSEGPIQFTLTVAKQAIGLQSPVPDQLAVARYLATADVEAHLNKVRPVYAQRAKAIML